MRLPWRSTVLRKLSSEISEAWRVLLGLGLGLGLNTIFDAILSASIVGAVGRGVVLHGSSGAGSRTR